MEPTNDEIEQVKNKLREYKTKIEQENIIEQENNLEIDIKGGRIWVHPKSDGTTVDIHYFNDTGDSDTIFNGTGEIRTYLNTEIGFPTHGQYEPYTPRFSNELRTHRINYEYFQNK